MQSRRLTKAEYERQMQLAVRASQQVVTAAKQRGEDAERQLFAGRLAVAAWVKKLKAIRPPAEIAQAHKDFTAGVAVLSARFAKVIDALKRGDRAKAEEAVASMSARNMPRDVVLRTLAARATFKRLGYNVGPTSTTP